MDKISGSLTRFVFEGQSEEDAIIGVQVNRLPTDEEVEAFKKTLNLPPNYTEQDLIDVMEVLQAEQRKQIDDYLSTINKEELPLVVIELPKGEQ